MDQKALNILLKVPKSVLIKCAKKIYNQKYLKKYTGPVHELTNSINNHNMNALKQLLTKGSPIDIIVNNNNKDTILTLTIKKTPAYDLNTVLDILFESGIDVNKPSKDDVTPLMVASAYVPVSHVSVFRSLLIEGADPNKQTKNGLTALMILISRNEENMSNIIELLLEYDADPNQMSKLIITPGIYYDLILVNENYSRPYGIIYTCALLMDKCVVVE
jgi:ankyrin repeat protein